ncbi:MAG: hypothetical protein ACXV8Q_00640 [Methylobacter sp.]
MPKSIFDRMTGWAYHPQAILTISFAGCFAAALQGSAPVWAALIAAAIAAPFAALVLFLPYLASVIIFAALLSLPQAIQSILQRSAPAAH